MAPRKKLSVPNALRPMYRHIEVSCGRERLSSVRSSSKSLATLIISSVDGDSPVERTLREILVGLNGGHSSRARTLRKNSLKASLPRMWAFALRPDSRSVSWRNLAISSLTRRSLRAFSSCRRVHASGRTV
jgi:hypothetical protein